MKLSDPKFQTELKKLGERIRQVRKHRGLRVLDLEVLSEISASNISRYERGSADVRFQTAYRLASALEVETKVLMDYDGPLPSNAGFKGLAKQKVKKAKA